MACMWMLLLAPNLFRFLPFFSASLSQTKGKLVKNSWVKILVYNIFLKNTYSRYLGICGVKSTNIPEFVFLQNQTPTTFKTEFVLFLHKTFCPVRRQPPSSCQPLVLLVSSCLLHFPVPFISLLVSAVLSARRSLWDCNGCCHAGGRDEGPGQGGKTPSGAGAAKILNVQPLHNMFCFIYQKFFFSCLTLKGLRI